MNQDILNQMKRYMNGVREADAEMMRPSFHSEATMYGFDEAENLVAEGSIDHLFTGIEQMSPIPNMVTEATILAETSNTASVKIELISESDGIHWTDFMNVIKIGDEWKIVSKIYHSK
ncbi:nuclear transport factor 2 family protein [Streptococcus himalayensis]|uniref:Nuclear transport factor 2 family protein n=1 Tax=Streptococcus himalayensis TaxID=1888195 RepID=A0A917AA02_9STRE|nr:nuclear transport factor 2 family protein [Streptococcus himalayensis]GGE37502.1 hypothetical protein GCM10011510_18530 [Streptococcus himalayensis]